MLQRFVAAFSSNERLSQSFLRRFLQGGSSAEFDAHSARYENCAARDLGFSSAEFSELLADIICRSLPEGSSRQARERYLDGLRLDDLLLARACARGSAKAWERFLVLYREKLYRAARSISPEESTARELADSLYADLYGMKSASDGLRVSKLNSYTGQGSLEGWLKTVLAQEYVNRYRRERKFVPFDDTRETDVEFGPVKNSPEPAYEKLAAATDAALVGLSAEAQFLMAAYYLDGRTLAEIGRILGVHESTVSRRLEKITSGLRKQIVKELSRIGVSRDHAEEMLAMDVRDLEVNVASRLAQGRRGESFSR